MGMVGTTVAVAMLAAVAMAEAMMEAVVSVAAAVERGEVAAKARD